MPNVGEDTEKQELFYIAGGIKNGTSTLENWHSLIKLSYTFPPWPSNSFIGIYLREMKAYGTEQLVPERW